MVCARGMRGVAQWGVNSVVEFGILVPVQAVRDGREVELGGPRRRAATREAMPPARRPGWQSIPVPVVPGFLPGDPGGDPPGGARVQVALLEVNAPVAA